MFYMNQVKIMLCGPPLLHYCTLPKKAFTYPLSLGKKGIYLETQLKGRFTDLF